jgi:ATP adenylyltransferase/5',5'''-P-1,P-4-tetraphosphate phosphorylase II
MLTALTSEVDSLFERQLNDWELARENYTALQNVRLKIIPFTDYDIIVQFNPKRIISSSAKVDHQSISKRPCFLCGINRPIQQIGITWKDDFVLLVNPYPVFQRHLTIPTFQHQPQHILHRFGMLLQFAKDLPQFSIIYNGPECGASAPDHFHFQAIQRGVLPIEPDFTARRNCLLQSNINGMEIFTWDNYLRKMITIYGSDQAALENIFDKLYGLLAAVLPSDDEPMMNILTQFDDNNWIIHVFPRKQHRPRQYFEQGDKQLLLSPASIDMGGVLILPREEDFNKITKAAVIDIYEQVCVDDLFIHYLLQKLI